LPSFGERLKLEREKHKMTLEQISTSTKISTRMLQALEEEKFSQLPGGIFNKGFVRAYARTVGIDEEQAVTDYLEASGDAPAVQIEPGLREPSRDGAARNTPLRITDDNTGRLEIRAEVASRQLPWGVFAAVLLVVALALSLWSYRREQQKLEHTSTSRHAAQQSSNGTGNETGNENATGAPASAPGVLPASEAVGSSPVPSAASSSQSSPSAASSGKGPEASAVPAPGEFVVVVQARDESWLSITVDGKHLEPQTLQAGDERTFRAVKNVVARVGNAGAIDFLLNGKALPVGGESGEVKTVMIGPAGLVPTADLPPAAVTQ